MSELEKMRFLSLVFALIPNRFQCVDVEVGRGKDTKVGMPSSNFKK